MIVSLPSFPKFTRNEKIFIFSAFVITIIFWGGFLGYYLIKLDRIVNSETKPIDISDYRLPTSSPPNSPTPSLRIVKKTIPTPVIKETDNQKKQLVDESNNIRFSYPAFLSAANLLHNNNLRYLLSKDKYYWIKVVADEKAVNMAMREYSQVNFLPAEVAGITARRGTPDTTKDTQIYIFTKDNRTVLILTSLKNKDKKTEIEVNNAIRIIINSISLS